MDNRTSTRAKVVPFSSNGKFSAGSATDTSTGSLTDASTGSVNDLDVELAKIDAVLAKKSELLERRAKLEKQVEEKQKKQLEAEKEQLFDQRNELLEMISECERAITLYKNKADIDQTLVRIKDLKGKVFEIESKLGISSTNLTGSATDASSASATDASSASAVELVDEITWMEKILSSSGTLVVSLLVLVGLVFLSYNRVELIGEEINKLNLAAQNAGDMSQMLPPSISKLSFQKMWFSWLNVFANLIVAILIMALIAPDKLIFILPFTKNPNHKWKHFFEQKEEQKQWQSFAYLACVLLFLALCHSLGK